MTALLVGAVAAYGDGCLGSQFGKEEKGLATLGVAEHFTFISGLENGPEGLPVSTLLLTLLHVAQQLSAGGQAWQPDVEVVLFGIVLLQHTPRQETNGSNTKTLAAFAVAACLEGFYAEWHGRRKCERKELEARCLLEGVSPFCDMGVEALIGNLEESRETISDLFRHDALRRFRHFLQEQLRGACFMKF
jgi:hypothetical protein